MKEITEAEALKKAASYCSVAERSAESVRQKVEAYGLEEEAVDRIVERLIQDRFVDDKRFARAFVRDKLIYNKWGKQKISVELYKKGIASSLRKEVLSEIDEEEYQSVLYAVLETKIKSVKVSDERILYAKLFRFALGRGFESEHIQRCLKRLTRYEEDFEEAVE